MDDDIVKFKLTGARRNEFENDDAWHSSGTASGTRCHSGPIRSPSSVFRIVMCSHNQNEYDEPKAM
jgi:hypothetical protein